MTKAHAICHKGDVLCQVFGHGEAEKYALIAFGLVVLTGIILGAAKKITVYRDFADATTVVTSMAGPVAVVLLAGFFNLKQGTPAYVAGKWIGLVVEVFLVLSTAVGTWRDNRSIWKAPLALLTKYSVAALLTLGFIFYLSGGAARKKGESEESYQLRNQESKRFAFGVLGAAAGLLILLVRNREFRASREAEIIHLPISNRSA